MSKMQPTKELGEFFIDFLRNWKEEKEEQGYFPSVELLLDELEGNE